LAGGSDFCVPNQFYNPHGPAPVTDKRNERCAPTRSPTILIRGAPFIQTPGIKTRGNFSPPTLGFLYCENRNGPTLLTLFSGPRPLVSPRRGWPGQARP
jgi:hypothetical protein